MKTIYQHTMMRRKIRRYARMPACWRVPPEIARLRLLPLTREEQQLLFGADAYSIVMVNV